MKKWKETERNGKKRKEMGKQHKYQIKVKNFPQIQIFIDKQKYKIKIREKKIMGKKGKENKEKTANINKK